MSRYIDADALIMALRLEYPMIPMFKESRKEWEEKTEGYRKAEEVINDAPTIDAVSEWIPCSERLPQYRDVVLISTFWGVRVAERDGIKEDGTDDFWYMFLDDATAHPRYVYAWMPLPKPYGEREGE